MFEISKFTAGCCKVHILQVVDISPGNGLVQKEDTTLLEPNSPADKCVAMC